MPLRRVGFLQRSCYKAISGLLLVTLAFNYRQKLLLMGFGVSQTFQVSHKIQHSDDPPLKEETTALNRTDCRIRQKLVYASRQHCKKGPFKEVSEGKDRNIALVVRGESFRGLGGYLDRTIIVNNESFQCQEAASKSHVEHIIQPLESCGYRVDVFLKTLKADTKQWGANSSQQLIDWYNGRVAQAAFDRPPKYSAYSKPKRDQGTTYEEAWDMLAAYSNENQVSWDAVLVIRFDLVFKRPFGSFHYNKWAFAFKQVLGSADVIHWIPWTFTNCAVERGFQVDLYAEQIGFYVGSSNVTYILKEMHESNTMVDRNPLYKQCRPEQKFNIDGGFGILLFSPGAISKEDVIRSAEGVLPAFYVQGYPRKIPRSEIAIHIWLHEMQQKEDITKSLRRSYVENPETSKRLDVLPGHFNGIEWAPAFESMRQSFSLAINSASFRERALRYKTRFRRALFYDRVVFVRLDYKFSTEFISAYHCDIDVSVCVGFGARQLPTLPVFAIVSHMAAKRFVAKSKQLTDSGGENTSIIVVFEQFFGLPLKTICRKC